MNALILNGLLIGGLTCIGGVVPSIVALVISARFTAKKQALKTALKALYEIRYLLALEATAVDLLKEQGISRQSLRAITKDKSGLRSTGLFSPSVLDRKITSYQSRVDES